MSNAKRRFHKGVLCTPEGIPVDQAATEFEECAVNVGTALETNTEATEVMQPGMRAFNDPAIFPQVAAVFGAALGDHRLDTALAQRAPSRNRDRRRPRVVAAAGGCASHESAQSRRSKAAIA